MVLQYILLENREKLKRTQQHLTQNVCTRGRWEGVCNFDDKIMYIFSVDVQINVVQELKTH